MATINDVAAMHLLRAASEVLQKHWGDGDDPLAWKGVEWSEQGRVTGLIFAGNAELIVLPAEIGLLGALLELRLSGCSRLKELPTTMGQLHALVTLNLGGCSALTVLPNEIGELQALASLNLDQCVQPQSRWGS